MLMRVYYILRYPYLIIYVGKVLCITIYTWRGVFVARFDGRASSKASVVERVTAWVPRFSCTDFFVAVQLFQQ